MKLIIKNRLCLIEKKEVLLSGNVNTYFLEVEYDSTYDGRQLILYFKNDNVKKISPVSPNNIVTIPHEVLEKPGKLYVGIFSPNSKDGTLIDRYCSNFEDLKVIEGAYDKEATYTEEITPSLVEQYLQEMREFYNESLEEYNNNADEKTKEYNDNTVLKLEEYNNNAKSKADDFNNNYDEKKKEIDTVAKEVTQNKTDIEQIEKRVSVSESNAKASETNAKTSEQNAQKSAENASEILTNVISIQTDINTSKTHIDEQKESVDNSVEEVNGAVTEATNQAAESKKQADIATNMANQTTADKQAVETAKNEVSKIKTSVEQTKTATEQIRTDTQGIYDNTVQAKNETLEAKTEVEKSLENERNESDKKYARAIETDEIVIDGSGQVELDEDGYMKEFSAEGNLPEITQEKRNGINKLYLDNIQKSGTQDGVEYSFNGNEVTLNGTATKNTDIYAFGRWGDTSTNEKRKFGVSKYTLAIIGNTNQDRFATNMYNGVARVFSAYKKNLTTRELTEEQYIANLYLSIFNGATFNNETFKIMVLEGEYTEDTLPEYEPYGIMPSLDYSSDFENIVKNVDISNNQGNIFNANSNNINFYGENNANLLRKINNNSVEIKAISIWSRERVRIEKLKPNTFYNISCIIASTTGELTETPRGIWDGKNYNTAGFLTTETNKRLTINVSTDENGRLQFYLYCNYTGKSKSGTIIYDEIQVTEGKELKEYSSYNGYETELTLSDNQFLGNFQGYKNYIEENKVKGHLKILTFNGTENFIKLPDGENYNEYRLIINERCINNVKSNYFNDISPNRLVIVGGNQGNLYIRIDKKYNLSTIELLKAFLKTKYEEGKPAQILYITNEEYKEDLSIENKFKINSLKTYKGINNIYCKDCKISFKSNRNIKKVIEENTLKERKISDQKYSKALKGILENKQTAQIYAENKTIDNLVIKGNEITQKTRTGYNRLDTAKLVLGNANGITKSKLENGKIKLSGTTTDKISNCWLTNLNETLEPGTYTFHTNVDLTSVGAYLLYDVDNNKIPLAKYTAQFTIDKETTLKQLDIQINPNNTIEKEFELMIYAGTEEKSYEPYGIMPSLDYPSEFKNIVKNVDIQNNQKNFLDMSNAKGGSSYGVNVIVNSNGTYSYIGTATNPAINVWLLGGFDRYIPIFVLKAGTYYCKDVRIFSGPNTLIAENESKTLKEDTPITGVRAAQAVTGQTYNEIKYPMITRIEDKDMPYEQYKGQKEQITLSEGQFIGNFNGYKNYIGSNKLKRRLKILTLTGQENWIYEEADNKFGLYNIKIDTISASSKKLCTHYKSDSGGSARNSFGLGKDFVRCHNDNNMTLEEWKIFLAQQYEAGTPVQILYITNEEYEEDLPEGTQNTLNSIELMNDLNIISIENGTFSFEYNKSLYRILEEKDTEIIDLKNQIALNGNYELIKEITSTTEQQEFKFENLKLEKAIIYFEATPSTGETNPGELITTVNNFNNIGVGAGLNVGKYGRYIVRIDKLTNNIYKVRSDFNINTDSVFANTTQSRENFNLIQASEINEIKIKHWNAGTGVGTKVTLYGVRIPGSDVQALSEVTEENVIEENINYDQEIISDINTSESEVLEDE